MSKRQAVPEDEDLSGLQEESAAAAEEGSSTLWGRLTPPVKGRAWRRILAWFFLILGCIALPLAVMGAWIRGSVFDSDGFESAMGSLASEPAVQSMVTDVLSDRITEALALEQRLQEALPDGLAFVAPPISDRVDDWINGEVGAVVASDEFATVWTASLGFVHTTLSDFLRGEGRVELGPGGVIQIDLSPTADRVVQRLQEAGVSLPEGTQVSVVDGKIDLIQVEQLDKVKSVLTTLNRLFIVLPILAVVFLAGSVAVAVRRQRAAVRAGAGMMISMAVFIVVLALAGVGVVHLITQAGASGDVGQALWGRLTLAMRGTAWGLFLLGLILFVYPRIVRALRSERFSETAGRAAGAGWVISRPVAWLAAHRAPVAVTILVAAFLVLVLWTGPGWVPVLVIFIVTALIEVSLLFVAKAHDIAVKAADATPTTKSRSSKS